MTPRQLITLLLAFALMAVIAYLLSLDNPPPQPQRKARRPKPEARPRADVVEMNEFLNRKKA